jgi:mitochondrial ATPase complex subunit ATP10
LQIDPANVLLQLHAEGFVSKTNEAHLSNPRYQYIQINLQENILKSFLVNLFTRSIKSQVPAHLHDTYLVSTENMEALRQPLGMTNKHIGYTFLVDDKLRVRWAGCGDAKGEEAEGLDKCVRQLLERLEAPKNVS